MSFIKKGGFSMDGFKELRELAVNNPKIQKLRSKRTYQIGREVFERRAAL